VYPSETGPAVSNYSSHRSNDVCRTLRRRSCVTGIEHFAIKPDITTTNPLDLYDYPISHSLATDVLWGALLSAGYSLLRKHWRGTLLIFAAVLCHWFLDFIAHRADMPLAPGIHKYYGWASTTRA